jgi:heterodisulfide reductase subunit C
MTSQLIYRRRCEHGYLGRCKFDDLCPMGECTHTCPGGSEMRLEPKRVLAQMREGGWDFVWAASVQDILDVLDVDQ